MAGNRHLRRHATLPERYARFEVLASSIDYRGRLVVLLVDPADGGPSAQHWRRPVRPYDAIAVVCDSADAHEIPLRGLDQLFNEIDTFGDGVVLGAARVPLARADDESCLDPVPEEELRLTLNVKLFDGGGNQTGAFYAGDGIEQLLTDPQGRIWISYFDEASYWSRNPDGTRSYRFMVGLARWDNVAAAPWLAPNHTGNRVVWCDCYALNVGRTVVYACPYTDFPLVELDASGVRSVTSNPITRCNGLAVSGSTLAFLDQHRHGNAIAWQIRRACRRDTVITETGRQTLVLPDGRPPRGWARGKIGRDATLWLYEDGNPRQWYRYETDC